MYDHQQLKDMAETIVARARNDGGSSGVNVGRAHALCILRFNQKPAFREVMEVNGFDLIVTGSTLLIFPVGDRKRHEQIALIMERLSGPNRTVLQ